MATIRFPFPLLLARPAAAGALLPRIGAMLRAIESRRQLAALDARGLADLGLTRADAAAEAARAPWDLTPSRRR